MRRRGAAIAAVPALGVAAAGVVVAASIGGGGGGGGAHAASSSRAGTAVVARRTLVDQLRVDGTLGYSGQRAAANRLSGTITWLPPTGVVVEPGHTLFKVDGKPVVLMDGTLPAYRALRTGTADGADIRQLERGLARLGYDPGTVDDHYDSATAAAVRAWQADNGLPRTGRVALGRIVFLPGARRVTDVKVSLGSTIRNDGGDGGVNPHAQFVSYTTSTTPTQTTPTQTTPTQTTPTQTTPTQTTPTQTTPTQTTPTQTTPTQTTPTQTTPDKTKTTPTQTTPARTSTTPASNGNGKPNGTGNNSPNANGNGNGGSATDVLMTTSTHRVVTAKVDVSDQTLVAKGGHVRVELPDGRVVPGRIVNVGTVATADNSGSQGGGGGGATTITITIHLRSARAAGRLDQAPVSVQIARTTKRNVLAVPVQALVARSGGRYAVERADGRLVDVTPGVFANGYVELVSGAIHEGDRVRVPQ